MGSIPTFSTLDFVFPSLSWQNSCLSGVWIVTLWVGHSTVHISRLLTTSLWVTSQQGHLLAVSEESSWEWPALSVCSSFSLKIWPSNVMEFLFKNKSKTQRRSKPSSKQHNSLGFQTRPTLQRGALWPQRNTHTSWPLLQYLGPPSACEHVPLHSTLQELSSDEHTFQEKMFKGLHIRLTRSSTLGVLIKNRWTNKQTNNSKDTRVAGREKKVSDSQNDANVFHTTFRSLTLDKEEKAVNLFEELVAINFQVQQKTSS